MAGERDLFLRRVLIVYTHPLQTLLFVLLGSAILFDPALFRQFFLFQFFPPQFDVRLVGLAFISFGVILMLFNYLQYGERRSESRSYAGATDDYRVVRETERLNQFVAHQSAVFEHELAAIRSAIEKGVASHVIELSPAEKNKLLEDVSKSIETTLSQSFLKAVDSKYSEEAVRGVERRFLFGDVESVRRRLTSEVDALRRRANSNLAIGSVTTVLAMTSLAYVALGRETTFDTGTSILSYYVPRISFVIFIEVFAYFFLRLYKARAFS